MNWNEFKKLSLRSIAFKSRNIKRIEKIRDYLLETYGFEYYKSKYDKIAKLFESAHSIKK